MPSAEPLQQLARRQHTRAGRGELDRERNALEPPHDRGDLGEVRRHGATRHARPLEKKRRRLRRRIGPRRGAHEGRELHDHLTRHAEPLARRHQHDEPYGPLEQTHHDGRREGDLLEIVEHEQRVSRVEELVLHTRRELLEGRRIGRAPRERHEDRMHEIGLVPRVRQIAEPRPTSLEVTLGAELLDRRLGDARLPHAGWPDHRDEPVATPELVVDAREHVGAAHERAPPGDHVGAGLRPWHEAKRGPFALSRTRPQRAPPVPPGSPDLVHRHA